MPFTWTRYRLDTQLTPYGVEPRLWVPEEGEYTTQREARRAARRLARALSWRGRVRIRRVQLRSSLNPNGRVILLVRFTGKDGQHGTEFEEVAP